jgi:competence protein CoiA
MQFSIVNGKRVKPFPKGKGACAACGNRTISRCGSRNLWHWAHEVQQSCDPWWENETQWHREWKSYWPDALQEIVHFSAINGEKHIADVKTSSGLVIEFQNSAMNDEELASREAFYGNMIWVVNGASFAKNIEICAKLPIPSHPLSQDMRIYPPRSGVRDYMKSRFTYYLVSENEPDATMVEAYDSRDIQSFVEETYDGHHLFIWKHAREIWYRANVPVYLDFGENVLWEIKKFNAGITRCLRAVSKAAFIASNEGIVGAR